MASMASSVTAAPPILAAGKGPTQDTLRVRSQMYSAFHSRQVRPSTVNTIPDRSYRALQLAGQELQPEYPRQRSCSARAASSMPRAETASCARARRS